MFSPQTQNNLTDSNETSDSINAQESNEQQRPSSTVGCPLRLDAQEFYDINEDNIVDFETAEEFLLHFSRVGNVHLVKKLISLKNSKETSLDIDCKGTSKANYGWSPLHLSTYFGHSDVVEILLKNCADVNIQNEEGDTPLHKAAYTGRENIVIQLLANNANVFMQNGDGLRAYELAKTESIRKLLIAAEKSDIKRREERFLSAARNGDTSIIKELLEDRNNCVDINCVDASGNTALHCAAYRGQNETVIFLLKNGIDTTIKNNHGQLAANVASTISLKQLIQETHLSVMTPKVVAALKNKSVARFEGPLLKKGRFFGWRLVWAVLERGVFSFYQNRADAASGIRRKGYKYLENAMTEVMITHHPPATQNPPLEYQQQLAFIIIFGDRSKAMFSLNKNQTELDLQKWISAINDHIYFSTNFIKQGTHIEDSDEEEEAAKLLSPESIQDMISTANAHQAILEKHINALQQLLDDESMFATGPDSRNLRDDQLSTDSNHSMDSISRSTIPSIKFHLNLILESSKNANSSLNKCLVLVSHQNQSRQAMIRQEKEKVRFLEEALQLLAREHHELERSVSKKINPQNSTPDTNNYGNDNSIYLNHSNHSNLISQQLNQSLARSYACLSATSTTDIDEYFDAFDDAFDDDDDDNNINNEQLPPLNLDNNSTESNNIKISDAQQKSNLNIVGLQGSCTHTFHTAEQDTTLNDSISTLSPDDDNNNIDAEEDRTIASEDLPFTRDHLPAQMVPRDEVGLWSILKHCIGKELSKITFPVIFNEPLSFLQRMVEMFQYSHYLTIADQCDDIVERMENICAFVVSAYSSNWLRLNKPFNPLLGETFEYEIASSQTKVVCEQVSHHPPISACHAESPNYILRGSSSPKLRFWGKSIEVKPEGFMTLELKTREEVYTWKSINCCVHNIIVGKLWYEQYGTIEVSSKSHPFKLILNFKPAGWFGHDLNRFDGFLQNGNKEKLRFFYGKWNDYLKSSSIEDYEEYLKANNNKFRAPDKPMEDINKTPSPVPSSTGRKMMSKLNNLTKQLTGGSLEVMNNMVNTSEGAGASTTEPITPPDNLPPEEISGDIPKSDSSHSLDISNSRVLWKVDPKPENSALYYNFTNFTFGLNELPQDKEILNRLPQTDSRFRPDIRKLEEGDLDAAASEKNRLEEKQRESRRLRKKGKMKEFDPLWFRLEANKHTGVEDWCFTNEYWNRDWSKCPDIF